MEKITVGIDLATLTRREFLGRATQGAVVAAAAAVLPWDRALAQTKLNVGTMKIGDLSPFFLALERAFFKEAGLDINVAAMVGGAAVAPALASGALNIGWSNVVSIYQGHLQGFDYRFIANGAINKRGTNDVFGFQVAVDSPIRSAATGATPRRSSGSSCRSPRWNPRSSTSRSTPSWRLSRS
ncbi:MAG: ABC transporter substrate-binding protein [Candidatus Rokubacteria bacterium]|nr:ABC transporter substrate-binding protein [Candidatus Rokubacteria bacterium]